MYRNSIDVALCPVSSWFGVRPSSPRVFDFVVVVIFVVCVFGMGRKYCKRSRGEWHEEELQMLRQDDGTI